MSEIIKLFVIVKELFLVHIHGLIIGHFTGKVKYFFILFY